MTALDVSYIQTTRKQSVSILDVSFMKKLQDRKSKLDPKIC